jgi:electron transfer flavoprotein alpha subunit
MKLVIHPEKLNTTLVDKLVSLCPFKAIDKSGDGLSINAGCKLCKLCVKNSGGAITLEEDRISVDKTL